MLYGCARSGRGSLSQWTEKSHEPHLVCIRFRNEFIQAGA
ncbi:hypothetical protein T12_8264 [Trichinella patagoniensis]|uniref:Uncharacterized protein n=1 Tax=Trichinella patagoniensis TaxID=990121 RepID=A0A0V0ZIR3_9BILA|nr:hypothetical protein T12_8264 [Trichinella patagoniensis]